MTFLELVCLKSESTIFSFCLTADGNQEVETLAGNAMSVRAATAAWVAAFSAVDVERWDAESQ